MNDWHESTRADYASKVLGSRSGYGVKPALLIVAMALLIQRRRWVGILINRLR